MENIYWNQQGKYESNLKKIEQLMPTMCYTDNKHMNLFIIVSAIYYDVYNNGGCNLEYSHMNNIKKYLIPFDSQYRVDLKCDEKTLVRKFKNKKTLEKLMNRTIEIIKDQNLSYTQYVVYQNFKDKKLRTTPLENFDRIIFGEKDYYDKWIKSRLSGSWHFKMMEE